MASSSNFAVFRLLNAELADVGRFPPHSPAVLLGEYWRSIAPAPGVLPGRQHFDPLDLDARIIRWIFLMDVIRSGADLPLDYLYRLVGTGNVQLVGRDATGELASVVFDRVDAPFVLETFDLTVKKAAPTYWIATVPQDRVGDVTIQRGLFPLARDGRTVDMLLCIAAPWPPE